MIKKFSIALLLPLATAVHADVSELQQKLAKLGEFESRFSQQAFDFDGQLVQQSEGTIAVKAPLKFDWQQQSPDPLRLVSDGEAVYYYDPYVEQVTISAISEVVEQTPLPLLTSQDPELWSAWQVEAKDNCYGLTKADNDDVSMQICFSDSHIESLQVIDAQGNRTLMELNQFEVNPQDDAKFDFAPPEGTYIDDQRVQ